MMKNKYYKAIGIVLGVLVVVSLVLGLASSLGIWEGFRIVFGSVYVLFLPGFLLTFIFFPLRKKRIDWVERVVLGFALSIALVPLVVFYLNLIGLGISSWSSFFTILGILIIESLVLWWRNR
jgi:uncharacterized membrane protein